MTFCFPDQQADEKVLMVIRKHFIVYLGLLVGFSVIFIIPSVLAVFVIKAYDFSSISPTLFLSLVLGILMYLLYGILFLTIAWIGEAFDVFILTDKRLIDVTQVTFFERTVAATPLDQIQDTTSHINGIVQSILNYGNVDVQTAGKTSSFFIDNISHPGEVSHAILEEAQKHKQKAYGHASPLPDPKVPSSQFSNSDSLNPVPIVNKSDENKP